MVKKNVGLKSLDLVKVFYNSSVFGSKQISKMMLSIYSLSILILMGIVGILINNIENYSPISHSFKFFSIVFGYPLFFLIIFGIIYVILNSFDNIKKSFIDFYLVSSSIVLPYLLLITIFDYIAQLFFNSFFITYSVLIILLIAIYMVIMYIINLKNYSQTSYYRIVFSLFMLYLLLFITTIYFKIYSL